MLSNKSATHYNTHTKSKVQGVRQFLVSQSIPHNLRDIFKKFGVRSERASYKMLKEEIFSYSRHNSGVEETRGCKYKVTDELIHKADSILQDRDLQLEKKRLT